MGKAKQAAKVVEPDTEPEQFMGEPDEYVQDELEQPKAAPAWGLGFERAGAKWRAYRVCGDEKTYITPAPGRELHSVYAHINAALSKEINQAIRNRGKP